MAEGETIWRVAQPNADLVDGLARALDLHPLLARLLVNRGMNDPEAARRFLRPSLDDLRDPGCLPDVDKAVDRLAQAIERRERIFVHGDYDADGVTSAALA